MLNVSNKKWETVSTLKSCMNEAVNKNIKYEAESNIN